jgi:N-acetylmuramic acid 6-phosphate etherase
VKKSGNWPFCAGWKILLDKWYYFGIVPCMIIDLPPTEIAMAENSGLDTWSDETILKALADGQERAIAAVRAAIPQIAAAASAIAGQLAKGGRLFYAGAGASIRIGVHDGAELPATFGMAEDRVAFLIAGGRNAMFETLAGEEDDAAAGARAAASCAAGDALIAIAASGTTPYTVAAAAAAHQRGAKVIAVVNNPATPLGAAADIEILLDSGPEVIAGSTRMGAGTAQKAALNLLSTLVHIKLGAVHDGLMVNLKADNRKLRKRARDIVMHITGKDAGAAEAALAKTGYGIKPAILICAGANGVAEADKLLQDCNGNLRMALARLAAP